MLNSIITSTMTMQAFLICTAVSLVLGVGTALLGKFGTKSSQSFAVTIAMLPVAVQFVIMMVNGNIGVGVAVAGAFGLVRFRSAPGTAREIAVIFLAMTLGLATGMGYVVIAAVFFGIVGLFMLLLTLCKFGESHERERMLKITIPENLDYDGLFDDLFERYTKSAELERVKTTNMGTLYELRYRILLKDAMVPKGFLDEIRCRNGNLTIVCGRTDSKDVL
ncbi:MAG: DUF4956 domain-containing protein [Clostridia bacterium]|nr:DUF4956 domain-containing protein [Clostridia bacterium]